MQITLSTSSFVALDTLLAVYTGSTVNALTLVASNDDCATGDFLGASCVTLPITRGTVYSLQADGANGAKGTVRILVTRR